jgi:hypothetical protein
VVCFGIILSIPGGTFIPIRDVWRYPEAPVIILKSLLKSLAVSAEPRLIEATLPDFLQFGPHLFQLCTNLFQALGDSKDQDLHIYMI